MTATSVCASAARPRSATEVRAAAVRSSGRRRGARWCRRSRRRSAGVAWWRAHGCDRRVRGPRGRDRAGRRRYSGERRRLRRFRELRPLRGHVRGHQLLPARRPPLGRSLPAMRPADLRCLHDPGIGGVPLSSAPSRAAAGSPRSDRHRPGRHKRCWSSMSPFRWPSSSPVAARSRLPSCSTSVSPVRRSM